MIRPDLAASRRLDDIPGVGPALATALIDRQDGVGDDG
jgi:hypothetical protein